MSDTILLVIFTLLILPGLIGVLFPLLPGIPYMFVVALIFGFIDKFQHLGLYEILILLFIAIVSLAIDYSAGILGAKYGGASKQALTFGLIGFIVGVIVLPPFGGIAGLFLGVLLAEITAHHDQRRAVKAATGSLLGTIAGIALNFSLAIIFIVLFIVFAKG